MAHRDPSRDFTFEIAEQIPAGPLAAEIAASCADVISARVVAVHGSGAGRRVTYEVVFRATSRQLTGEDIEARCRVIRGLAQTYTSNGA